jgi:hypothetical protein
MELGDVDGDGDSDPDSGRGEEMIAREEDKDVSGVVGGDEDDRDDGGVSGTELPAPSAVVVANIPSLDSAMPSSADAVVATSPAKSAREATW